jgi:hypothetical protein
MIKDTYSYRLAPLASLEVQRRFIVHATKDEYLLIEELLEDALDIERLIKSESDLSVSQLECLKGFIHELKDRVDPIMEAAAHETAENLIELSEDWNVIRLLANDCLRTLMFDLKSWERGELRGREAP